VERTYFQCILEEKLPGWLILHHSGVPKMLRINEFQFYELAIAIHPITLISSDTKYSEVVFDWMTAKTALQNIFKERALEFCYESANALYLALREIVPDDFDAAIAKIPDPNSQETTLGYSIYKVKEAAEKFETVLSAELSNSDTYWISPKGTHKTSVLMTAARQELPSSLLRVIPEEAQKELDEAGRCLLFDNSTAAGFHLFRATETVIREYYLMVVGSIPAKKSRNWGSYIHGLRIRKANPKVTGYLEHIKDQYRNPVLHPEVTLTPEDAQVLFGVCISAMSMMALEMNANPSAALPFPATAATTAGRTP